MNPWFTATTLGWTELTSWGVLYYAFGVLLAPMQAELGWSRSTLTAGFALALLVAGLAAVPVGKLLDRVGARPVMSVGSLIAPLLVFGWAHVHTQIAFFLIWAGMGLAMSLVLYEPAFAVIARSFHGKRDRALTVLTVGGGLASVVYVPLTTWLLSETTWRQTLDILALILLVVTLPPHLLFLRNHVHFASTHAPSPDTGVPPSLRDVLRERRFWWLSGAWLLSTVVVVMMNVDLITIARDRGLSGAEAAFLGSLVGGSQLPGRLLLAPLGARWGRSRLAALLFALQAFALLLALVGPSFGAFVVFGVIFGMASGALTPLRATVIAEQYDLRTYGAISGALALVLTGARSLAPLLVGVLGSLPGGSHLVLLLGCFLACGALLVMLPLCRS